MQNAEPVQDPAEPATWPLRHRCGPGRRASRFYVHPPVRQHRQPVRNALPL